MQVPSPAAVFPTPDRACASCHIRQGMYLSEGRSRAGFVAVSEKGWIRWKNRLCRFHPLRPFSPLQTALARHATSGKACTCRKAAIRRAVWRYPKRDGFAGRIGRTGPSPVTVFPTPDRACASCHIRQGMYLSEGRSRAGFVAVSEKGWIRWKNRLCRFHPLRPFSPLQTALARHAMSGRDTLVQRATAAQASIPATDCRASGPLARHAVYGNIRI